MTSPVIGFIGLGLMGGNMVENLQNKNFKPIVMDLNPEAVAAVVARGGSEASSAAELAAASDIIMLCLTTSTVVEKVMHGDDGILAGIKEGAVVIDFGTSIPASTRQLGAELAKKGAGMVDAALGRTPAHAKDGLLNIMAAGDKDTFDKVKPVLLPAQSLRYCPTAQPRSHCSHFPPDKKWSLLQTQVQLSDNPPCLV